MATIIRYPARQALEPAAAAPAPPPEESRATKYWDKVKALIPALESLTLEGI